MSWTDCIFPACIAVAFSMALHGWWSDAAMRAVAYESKLGSPDYARLSYDARHSIPAWFRGWYLRRERTHCEAARKEANDILGLDWNNKP